MLKSLNLAGGTLGKDIGQPFRISTDDAVYAMFTPTGVNVILNKYGSDVSICEIQDAYKRAEAWLCGGLAIAPEPEELQ